MLSRCDVTTPPQLSSAHFTTPAAPLRSAPSRLLYSMSLMLVASSRWFSASVSVLFSILSVDLVRSSKLHVAKQSFCRRKLLLAPRLDLGPHFSIP